MIKTYVAFDLETTGLSEEEDYIIEIGALKVVDGKVTKRFMEFVRPDKPISAMVTNLTGISNEMVRTARDTEEIIADFVRFCENHVLVGHNIMFDYKFMKRYAGRYGHPFQKTGVDTLKIARKVHRNLESKSLSTLCEYYRIENKAAHRAYHDALATAKLYQILAHYFEESEPKLFVPEELIYREKKKEPVTAKQKAFLKKLLTAYKLTLDVDMDQLTKSEASRRIDKIISEHGMLPRT